MLHHSIAPRPSDGAGAGYPTISRIIVPGVDVVRDGREEPFLATIPTLSSIPVGWGGIALENYTVPAVLIPFGAARQRRVSDTHKRPRSPVHLPTWDTLSSASRDSG